MMVRNQGKILVKVIFLTTDAMHILHFHVLLAQVFKADNMSNA